ncbi:hypothetical protein MFLAVUS_005216 [Mucor flavus]|uniref:Mitochondrial zinc maintenance protein 1, mitochondrial n=1 Tax=Mucor flavus TaxID=439312 RepID=A0ABP9YY45_9FUNG
MSAISPSKQAAIQAYRSLLKTQKKVFDRIELLNQDTRQYLADLKAIEAARKETYTRFMQFKNETNSDILEEKLQLAGQVETLLKKNVIQGVPKGENTFKLRITKETELSDNDTIKHAKNINRKRRQRPSAAAAIPEWSLQLTEQLMSNNHVAPLPSAIIIHSEDKDEQFQKYIDRQFTLNEANVLKNQLSETTAAASSSRPPFYQDNDDSTTEEQEKNAWWLSKNDQDGFYSISGLFFLFGFLFPPFWWIGSVWPKHVAERGGKMASL